MSNIAAGTTSGTALVSTGDTTGELQLQVNGTTPSVTLAANGSIGVGSSPSYGSNGQLLTSSGTGSAPTWTTVSAGLTLGTPVASTSGTSITFTGIPAGTKQIVISFVQVSANGTSAPLFQLGDAGGIETTGYHGGCAKIVDSASPTIDGSAAGFLVKSDASGAKLDGSLTIILENSTTFSWVSTLAFSNDASAAQIFVGTASKLLSAELPQVRGTTVNGTDTFDAGEINIAYK